MKHYFYLAISIFMTGFFINSSKVFSDEKPAVYAQLCSLQSQFPKGGSELITLDKIEDIVGIDQPTPSKLMIKESGIYFVMAVGQVGVDPRAPSAGGIVDIWIVKNGKTLSNSANRQYLLNQQTTSVVVTQVILPLNAGDTISFGHSANKPLHGLIAIDSKGDQLVIPSIVVSLYKIGS